MERLTFGYGVDRRHVDAPVRGARPPRPPGAESRVHPVVADPLPGESSDWAFFGLLAFTAVLFFRPQDQLPFLESAHLAEASALVGLGAMVAKRLVRKLPLVRLTPELQGLLAFGLVLVATTPFSFWPGGSAEVITGMYFKVLLIFVLMVNSLTTPSRLSRFVWLIVTASAYLSARAVADYVRGVNLVEDGRVAGAVSGIFGNPNDLALNMVAFLPFAVLLALVAGRHRATGRQEPAGVVPATPARIAAAAAALLMLATVVFTRSRGGALGFAAMVVVLLHHGRRLKPGLVPAAAVAAVLLLPMVPTSFWSRMSSITNGGEDRTGSREARREVMAEAAQVFLERPLTGIGAGQFKNYNPPGKKERWREAHDVWLQVASETGIFGLLAFAFLVFSAFRTAASARRQLASYARSGRQAPVRRPARSPGARRDPPAVGPPPDDSTDLGILGLHTAALLPSLAGWFVCAIFASVAYNWTFYYLLGLAVVTGDLTRSALAARTVAPNTAGAAPPSGRRAAWLDPAPAR
jgi:putative inorganic carbon (hco3(-)) transporter